jgi:hypothetical protein
MQQRFHDFNRPLVSFDENQRILGLLWPGRYCGFDNVVLGTNTITLQHGLSGIQETNLFSGVLSPKGVFITRQGVVVKEDGPIGPLPIASNAANAFKRIDTIVAEHAIVNILGGVSATYSIIQGPDGSETPAELTNPGTQIVLGYFTMAASAATTGSGIFTPAKVYHPGGLKAAILTENNKYENFNEFNQLEGTRVVLSDGSDDWIGLTSLGANTIKNVNQAGVANTIGFLPRSQSGAFLFITNFSSSTLTIQHTLNDGGGGFPLPDSIWANYAAIGTENEANKNIAPGGWALLFSIQGEGVNPYYTIISTSTDYGAISDIEASLFALNSALAGKVNRTAEGWKTVGGSGNPAFQANFSAAAGRPPQFKKDDNNVVYIRGAVNWGIGGSNTVVFTLPTGYRPTQAMTFANMILEEPLGITITTGGNVEIYQPSLGGVSSGIFNRSCPFRVD